MIAVGRRAPVRRPGRRQSAATVTRHGDRCDDVELSSGLVADKLRAEPEALFG